MAADIFKRSNLSGGLYSDMFIESKFISQKSVLKRYSIASKAILTKFVPFTGLEEV